MKQTGKVLTAITALVLVAGCSGSASPSAAPASEAPSVAPSMAASEAPSTAPSASTAAAAEAWTQSDIFKGFDPMAVDLTGFTPGPER